VTTGGGAGSWTDRVAPVERSTAEARATYDRLARWYDFVEAPFERTSRAAGIDLLAPGPDERVLEIGYGTGHVLAELARRTGPQGAGIGVDLSRGMAAVTRRRFGRLGLGDPILVQADARHLPLGTCVVDAVVTTFVLELMATEDIPLFLEECQRVLRPQGRLVVVSLALPARPGRMTRLYLLAHRRWPRLVDCRPLPLSDVLATSGFTPVQTWSGRILGLPVAGARSVKQRSQ
jgi:ubiquinone/menaquinone biosynthesis C-methylase UbiE